MNHVTWTTGPNSATDDLKELAWPTIRALLFVAERELKRPRELDPNDQDEAVDARTNSPVLLRRGLTRERRRELTELGKAADHLDHDTSPWSYVLFYRQRSVRERAMDGPGFVVLRVIHNRHLAPELLRLLSRRDDPAR